MRVGADLALGGGCFGIRVDGGNTAGAFLRDAQLLGRTFPVCAQGLGSGALFALGCAGVLVGTSLD
ncbi:MAG: hypothetical protein KDK97_12565, partial [Verrucomicrobiales bacterium]|nr:hypothetical protein [Verrucomicrobiales bacterium]